MYFKILALFTAINIYASHGHAAAASEGDLRAAAGAPITTVAGATLASVFAHIDRELPAETSTVETRNVKNALQTVALKNPSKLAPIIDIVRMAFPHHSYNAEIWTTIQNLCKKSDSDILDILNILNSTMPEDLTSKQKIDWVNAVCKTPYRLRKMFGYIANLPTSDNSKKTKLVKEIADHTISKGQEPNLSNDEGTVYYRKVTIKTIGDVIKDITKKAPIPHDPRSILRGMAYDCRLSAVAAWARPRREAAMAREAAEAAEAATATAAAAGAGGAYGGGSARHAGAAGGRATEPAETVPTRSGTGAA